MVKIKISADVNFNVLSSNKIDIRKRLSFEIRKVRLKQY